MTAPKDRTELIDTIAQAHFNYGAMRGMREWDNSADELKHAYLRHAIFILDAIEAAGCAVVPVEPTERMVERLRVSMNGVGGTLQNDLAVTIAASPYRKEQP